MEKIRIGAEQALQAGRASATLQTKKTMDRPYVICLMAISLDGKATGGFLQDEAAAPATGLYYDINRADAAQAFACGRVTMEESFTGGWQPDLAPYETAAPEPGDHIAATKARRFAVCFDRLGRLGWQAAHIEDSDPGYGGAHIIEVLTEAAPPARRAYLQSIGASYILAGERDTDLPLALRKLRSLFGISRMLLEGGPKLNGAFEREGLIDELSLVCMPLAAEAGGKPLFANGARTRYTLLATRTHGDCLHLRYKALR